MKYPSRLCKGCHEPTDTYRAGCRTCQARHRAIRLHKNPRISSGQPICPRCWRTAGISLPASSIQPENYGQRIAIENQWNPIYSICRACIHAPEGTVPLDSPRVYLPVNPRARRTSKQRIYPSRANPVLFLELSHCTRCEKPIDAGQDEWAVHDTGLASFLRARRKRLSHASASLPRSRSKATLCRANTMVHTPSAL